MPTDATDQDATRPLVLPVKPGVEVAYKLPIGLPVKERVKVACEGISSGSFYCVTHSTVFATNQDKEEHIRKPGTHELAWICKAHGIEVP